MKVFLSHPMHGKTREEVMKLRQKATAKVMALVGEDVEIINNYDHEDAPENAGRLWHLGRSIQQLGDADAVYLCGGFYHANGCLIEHIIARLYGVPVLNDKEGKPHGESGS